MTDHAAVLHRAQRAATAIDAFTGDDALDLDAAYAVQRRLVEMRLADGEHPTGLKLGFTSRAKMRQMGVDRVIGGRLTSGMAVADGGSVAASRFIHPRVEPEVAFRLGRDITTGLATPALRTAVDGIAVGVEIIDSRYRDFRFGLSDVVADNASSAGYALGPWMTPGPELESRLGTLGVTLEIDGRDVDTGSTAAILDSPWRALHAAVLHARRYGIELRAGQVILAGAATAAAPVSAGSTVRASIALLGSTTIRFSEEDA